MRALLLGALALVACAHETQDVRAHSELEPPELQKAPTGPDWPVMAARVIQREKTHLRECYDAEVSRVEEAAADGAFQHGEPVPPLNGKLVLALPVEQDGRVETPRIEDDSLKNANVTKCLLERAKALRLPPPPDAEPVELTVPFNFQLKGPAD